MAKSAFKDRPYLRSIFILKCPYCLETRLQKKGAWFSFHDGCSRCHYRFEREEGYFWGAPWMINYPITSLITLLLIVWIYRQEQTMHPLWIATIISTCAVLFAIFFFPFARAIWMVADHWLHPLNQSMDAFSEESDSNSSREV